MASSVLSIKKVLKLACNEAGEIIKKSFGSVKKISSKGKNDWVTTQDKKVEKHIIDTIKKYYPDSSFIAEESGASPKSSRIQWIIDPIDGTNNFIHDYPFFCTSIGVQVDGELNYGAIYDPLRKEFFYAEKGLGAFLNNKRIKTSQVDNLEEALLCTGFITSKKHYAKKNIDNFQKLLFKCRSIRRDGSAALDLAYVACGRLDGFWELGLNSWDTAAGVLLVKEAGGVIGNSQGKTFDILKNKSLIASNKYIFNDLMSNVESKIL